MLSNIIARYIKKGYNRTSAHRNSEFLRLTTYTKTQQGIVETHIKTGKIKLIS